MSLTRWQSNKCVVVIRLTHVVSDFRRCLWFVNTIPLNVWRLNILTSKLSETVIYWYLWFLIQTDEVRFEIIKASFFFFFFKFSLPKWTLRLLIPIIEKWGTPEWLSRKISEYGRMCQFIQINNSARKSVLKKSEKFVCENWKLIDFFVKKHSKYYGFLSITCKITFKGR